jgi:hypothetical protein
LFLSVEPTRAAELEQAFAGASEPCWPIGPAVAGTPGSIEIV